MTDGNPGAAPAEAEPKTFSHDYVRELREENKGLRLAKQAAERERDGLRGAAETAKAEADRRVIRAELKAHAIRAGIIDPDALKLLDISAVRLGDGGEVEGADELLEKFKEAKPHFFAAAPTPPTSSTTSSTARTPPAKPASGKKASEMTNQEFAAAMARINRGLPPG